MSVIDAILLGILQGLTEFLPVSSSGHLVILQHLLGYVRHDVFFDLVVHLATVFVVLFFMRTLFKSLICGFWKELRNQSLDIYYQVFIRVFVGLIPTAIVGLLLKDIFLGFFENLNVVGAALYLTAFLLFLSSRSKEYQKPMITNDNAGIFKSIHSQPIWKFFCIGFAQSLAITPGLSRSGSTIASGLLLGLSKSAATYYSFILAVPTILGASLLQAKEILNTPGLSPNWEALSAGFVAAFFVGLLGLGLLVKVVRQGRFLYFIVYLLLIGSYLFLL